jgi:hypothetical protein
MDNRAYTPPEMAEPARSRSRVEEAPAYDPRSITRRLAHERARRKARMAHKRRRRHANIRFVLTIGVLIGLIVFVALVVWHEVGRLFGI